MGWSRAMWGLTASKSKRHNLLTYGIYSVLSTFVLACFLLGKITTTLWDDPIIIWGFGNLSVWPSAFGLRPDAQGGRQYFLEVATLSSFSECFLTKDPLLENIVACPLAYTFTRFRALLLRSFHSLLIIVLCSSQVRLEPIYRWENWGAGEVKEYIQGHISHKTLN